MITGYYSYNAVISIALYAITVAVPDVNDIMTDLVLSRRLAQFRNVFQFVESMFLFESQGVDTGLRVRQQRLIQNLTLDL